MLGGGKFGHGFVSAGLSKALSPLADTDHLFRDGLVNAAIGGTVSEITGGDFGNGAVMAATQYAFNAIARRARAPSARQIQLAADVRSLRDQITAIAPGRPQPSFVGDLTPSSVSQLRRELALAQGDMLVRSQVGSRLSLQKQERHILGNAKYGTGGGSYFSNGSDAMVVFTAFQRGDGQILGTSSQGHIVFRYFGITGYNHNPGAGYINQPTNTFMIKGTSSPSIVPTNPIWKPNP